MWVGEGKKELRQQGLLPLRKRNCFLQNFSQKVFFSGKNGFTLFFRKLSFFCSFSFFLSFFLWASLNKKKTNITHTGGETLPLKRREKLT
jgi:preprotein translocase subunit SecG